MIDDSVTCICYGTIKRFQHRQDAINYFAQGFLMCDGSEMSRYKNILNKLISGESFCTDDD